MISLLRQRNDKGSIVTSNKELCDKLLDETVQQVPYLNLITEIKQRNSRVNTSSMSDFVSYNTESKSNLTVKTTEPNIHQPTRNSVMFNIPSDKPLNNQFNIRRDLNASSTNLSSAPTVSNTNSSSYPHEKRRLNRKKLKHVQQQLENRLNVKSAGTCDLYKELNKILLTEKSLKATIEERIEESEREKERKREIIYKNWYRNVYEVISILIYFKLQFRDNNIRNRF